MAGTLKLAALVFAAVCVLAVVVGALADSPWRRRVVMLVADVMAALAPF